MSVYFESLYSIRDFCQWLSCLAKRFAFLTQVAALTAFADASFGCFSLKVARITPEYQAGAFTRSATQWMKSRYLVDVDSLGVLGFQSVVTRLLVN